MYEVELCKLCKKPRYAAKLCKEHYNTEMKRNVAKELFVGKKEEEK
jgi:hypothetical protein